MRFCDINSVSEPELILILNQKLSHPSLFKTPQLKPRQMQSQNTIKTPVSNNITTTNVDQQVSISHYSKRCTLTLVGASFSYISCRKNVLF